MRKIVWISLASFTLGILLAGYIFVYLPDKNAAAKSFLDQPAASSGLFADETPQVRPDLDFVKISDKIGPAVVKIECERVERQSGMMGIPDMPGDDFWERFFGSPRRQTTPQERTVPVQGTGFFKTLLAFLIHMIPAFLIIAILVLSWKWPLIGGIGFILLGLAYVYWASRNIEVYALIYIPLFLTGVLFLTSWLLRDRIKDAQNAYNE